MKIAPDMVRETIQHPDAVNTICKVHAFYLKRYGSETLLVYAARDDITDRLRVKCVQWMEEVENVQ